MFYSLLPFLASAQQGLDGQNRMKADGEEFEYRYSLSQNDKYLAYTKEGDIWIADPPF